MAKPIIVNLPENLTIAGVEGLYSQLDPYVHDTQDVVLNGKKVDRADTAGLQTLMAFLTAMDKNHVKVSWGDTSETLVDAANNLGLKDYLLLG